MSQPSVRTEGRVRLDKWLWAARFYKTRSLAKTAIDGGKVRLNGARPKAAKEVAVSDTVTVTRGEVVQQVTVTAVAERRGSATVAAELYDESEESIASREAIRIERRLQRAGMVAGKGRPNKKERRRLMQLKA